MPEPPKKKRRLTTVLDELEFEGAPTKKDKIRPCRYCGLVLPHHYSAAGYWSAIQHDGPCGLPCLGGGVDAGIPLFHSDLCPECNGV
jgi:hypothetical protein